jgi:hypothetical protein
VSLLVSYVSHASSLRDGVLVQGEYKDIGRVKGGTHAFIPVYSQVRYPADPALSRRRVMEHLFIGKLFPVLSIMQYYLPQVVMSKKDSDRVRVLAVKDLFECIELCLIDEKGEPLLPAFPW